jgi:hypothetical protein
MAYEPRPDNMQRASSAVKFRPSDSVSSSNIMDAYLPSPFSEGFSEERTLKELEVAHHYMRMRKEIWEPLAFIVGLEWNVVEQMVRHPRRTSARGSSHQALYADA